jgi:hypothetical protein
MNSHCVALDIAHVALWIDDLNSELVGAWDLNCKSGYHDDARWLN